MVFQTAIDVAGEIGGHLLQMDDDIRHRLRWIDGRDWSNAAATEDLTSEAQRVGLASWGHRSSNPDRGSEHGNRTNNAGTTLEVVLRRAAVECYAGVDIVYTLRGLVTIS